MSKKTMLTLKTRAYMTENNTCLFEKLNGESRQCYNYALDLVKTGQEKPNVNGLLKRFYSDIDLGNLDGTALGNAVEDLGKC